MAFYGPDDKTTTKIAAGVFTAVNSNCGSEVINSSSAHKDSRVLEPEILERLRQVAGNGTSHAN